MIDWSGGAGNMGEREACIPTYIYILPVATIFPLGCLSLPVVLSHTEPDHQIQQPRGNSCINDPASPLGGEIARHSYSVVGMNLHGYLVVMVQTWARDVSCPGASVPGHPETLQLNNTEVPELFCKYCTFRVYIALRI